MKKQKRAADYGINVGILPKGTRNKITDVPGVRVGHYTMDMDPLRTGVTVIVPGTGDAFDKKRVAAAHVVNGYGKSLGLMQMDELGVLETPIALCGTLNVGLVHDALVQLVLEAQYLKGRYPTSINPVVGECNDGKLSDIAKRPVHVEHVRAAKDAATDDFAEGSVGAGKGLICHGLKGGIGSASRIVNVEGRSYTIGLLAMTNHGKLQDLTVGGRKVGPDIDRMIKAQEVAERGSAVLIVATDLPLDSRQLGRVLRRAPIGMARLGALIGHGSGEVVLGFTTTNRVPGEQGDTVVIQQVLREDLLDEAFRAVAECCEEAVLNSMFCAETTTGYRGDVVLSLADLWEELPKA